MRAAAYLRWGLRNPAVPLRDYGVCLMSIEGAGHEPSGVPGSDRLFNKGYMNSLDYVLPVWDATRVERRIVDAPLATAYEAVMTSDFLDAARKNRLVRALFAVRSAAERFVAWVRHRPFAEPTAPPTRTLKDIPSQGEWVKLEEDRPREFVFGVVGRFWNGETAWIQTDRKRFIWLDQPGLARIGCHLMLTPTADGRTLVEYEARTRTTDPKSRESFLRYWGLMSPFVGVVMRSTLRVIEQNALAMRVPRAA